jgi:uncharacterized protein (TIGR02996 family)
MTEHDAFLTAILDDPWSDGPRLMFADWLDEHGEGERAEFIRVQCRLNQLLHEPGEQAFLDAHVEHFRRRERELLQPWNFWEWFGYPQTWLSNAWPGTPAAQIKEGQEVCISYSQPGDYRQWYLSLHRGFVERVTCTAADWLAYGAAVLAAQPVVEVSLTQIRPSHLSGRIGWTENKLIRGLHKLPRSIFRKLPSGTVRGLHTQGYRWYETRQEAIEALLVALAAEWPGVKFICESEGQS